MKAGGVACEQALLPELRPKSVICIRAIEKLRGCNFGENVRISRRDVDVIEILDASAQFRKGRIVNGALATEPRNGMAQDQP